MLALVGSGEYLPSMESVDRQLLGLFEKPPKVVCLPTAAGTEGDAMIDDWMQRGVNHFTRLGADVEAVRVWDQATANDAAFAEQISGADFVYLSGGKPGYLYNTLNDSLAWEAIRSVLDRGGLLTGCSAGAMIQGEVFGGIRGGGSQPGFGLWPGVHVIPHFDQFPSAVVSSMRMLVGRKFTVLGVEGNTALVEQNGAFHVFGQGVAVWTKDEKVRLTDGETLPDSLVTTLRGGMASTS